MATPELDPRTGRFRHPETGKFLPRAQVSLHIVPPPELAPPSFGAWPADADEPAVVRVPRLPFWRRWPLMLQLWWETRRA